MLEEAQKHVKILWHFIDQKNAHIDIHINVKKREDYARSIFVLYTLGRASRYGLLSKEQMGQIERLFWRIYEKALIITPTPFIHYVILYGMRFLQILDIETKQERLIGTFRNQSTYADLFTYPVLTYIFISTYIECPTLKEHFPFTESLYHEGLKIFDFLLRTSEHVRYRPFHFAELSAWEGKISATLLSLAYANIENSFDRYLLTGASSSGVAKCMEDFARRNLQDRLQQCKLLLEKRRLTKFGDYIRPDQTSFADMFYTEEPGKQYVCLDTCAHLIHMNLNLYDKRSA